MRFSIVIPVYGTERYLPRCIDGLKAQTVTDFEVLVVDDCSSGPCRETVRPYGDFVRYIRHDRNRGAFRARCTGVAEAKGEYIVPLDPDDYLMPETFAKISATIDRDTPDVVSYWIDIDDGRRVWPHWCRHPESTASAAEMLHEIAEHRNNYSIVSKAVRKEVYLKAIGGLDLPEDVHVNTSEDFLATMAVLLCSQRVSNLAYAGYRYCTNPESITATRRTVDGFRRACEQTRFVHDAIREMSIRVTDNADLRKTVNDIILLAERWFCTEVMERSPGEMAELADVLIDTFHPDNVCRAFVRGYVDVVGSRIYGIGARIQRALRRFS